MEKPIRDIIRKCKTCYPQLLKVENKILKARRLKIKQGRQQESGKIKINKK